MSTRGPDDDPTIERHFRSAPVDEGAGTTAPEVSNEPLFRDRVRWGPIIAGLITTITTLMVLTVLGLAIGTTAFEPGETGSRTISTSAAAWGIISAIIAFFLGGWVAGRNSLGSADDNGGINGFLVGAAAVVLLLWLIGSGLGNLLGIVGANISEISDVGQQITQTDPADTAAATAQDSYDEARDSAWGTLAGLVLALASATLGGILGHPDRSVITSTTRTRRTATVPR